MLYFSYGSNMSSRRLLNRVASARFMTTAVLRGHLLHFHKKSLDGSAKCDAFATKRANDAVMGVVYEIASSHKPALDRVEGLGQGYEEKNIELITPSGEWLTAYTYYATSIDHTLKPYHWYKYHVLTGAMENSLSPGYVDGLRNVTSVEDPEPRRHALEMAIYVGDA
ncbi:MAG: gamma-glutamylcyclotransferase family protein [Candidatus Thiodiazotropha endolucinida]